MARLTFSIEAKLAKAARARARAQGRSISSYVARLITADLREAGILTRAPQDPEDQVRPALNELRRLGVDPAAVLRDAIARPPCDIPLKGAK